MSGGVRKAEAIGGLRPPRRVIKKNEEKDQPEAVRVVYHDVILRASWNAP
jgi:hypothetical protein